MLGLFFTQTLAALALMGAVIALTLPGAFTSSPAIMLVGGLATLAVMVTLALRWFVVVPVVLHEELSWVAALNRSSQLVAGNTLQVLAVLIAIGALAIGVSLLVTLVSSVLNVGTRGTCSRPWSEPGASS